MTVHNEFWNCPPVDFLGALDSGTRAELLALAGHRRLRRGQSIFRTGSRGENVYILKSGRAKVYELAASGKEVILWFCMPGEIFGLAEIPRGGQREVSAVASTDAEVLVVKREQFKQFLLGNSAAAFLVIDLLSSRMRMLGSLVTALATEEVAARLARLLLGLSHRYQGQCDLHQGCSHHQIDLRLTHQDIADMIGTTRQSVSSLIGDWKQKAILFTHNHKIYIQSETELRMQADVAETWPHYEAPDQRRERIHLVKDS